MLLYHVGGIGEDLMTTLDWTFSPSAVRSMSVAFLLVEWVHRLHAGHQWAWTPHLLQLVLAHGPSKMRRTDKSHIMWCIVSRTTASAYISPKIIEHTEWFSLLGHIRGKRNLADFSLAQRSFIRTLWFLPGTLTMFPHLWMWGDLLSNPSIFSFLL